MPIPCDQSSNKVTPPRRCTSTTAKLVRRLYLTPSQSSRCSASCATLTAPEDIRVQRLTRLCCAVVAEAFMHEPLGYSCLCLVVAPFQLMADRLQSDHSNKETVRLRVIKSKSLVESEVHLHPSSRIVKMCSRSWVQYKIGFRALR